MLCEIAGLVHCTNPSHLIRSRYLPEGGVLVDEHQEQEYEFLRQLEEEQIDRRKLLKRGLAAGAGLTIFSLSADWLVAA